MDPDGENAYQAMMYLYQYRQQIQNKAIIAGIPENVLKSVVWNENAVRTVIHSGFDFIRIGQLEGKGSLGICQIQCQTAALLLFGPGPSELKNMDAIEFESIKKELWENRSVEQKLIIAAMLYIPEFNIGLAAEYLKLIKDIIGVEDETNITIKLQSRKRLMV